MVAAPLTILYILGAIGIITAIPLVNLLFVSSRNILKVLDPLLALAAGVLLGNAFFHLIPEAMKVVPGSELLHIVALGFVTTFAIETIMQWRNHLRPVAQRKKPVGYVVLFDDMIHNAIDAGAIAATFLISVPLGIFTTLSVALHEIPHELGDYAILISAGFSRKKALLYNFYSELVAFAGVGIVLLLNVNLESLASFSAFSAGVFLYVAAVDLIPELHKSSNKRYYMINSLLVIVGLLVMLALGNLLPEASIG